MLRYSQDILDVPLVCGNEDGWRDKSNPAPGMEDDLQIANRVVNG